MYSIDMPMIGEIAALGTAVCWAFSALLFESASKKIGALSVNLYKVISGFVLLSVFSLIFRGMPLPLDVSSSDLLWLGISGFVGFVISDMFLFNAYIAIGARIATLFSALSPPMTALIGFFLLGETMSAFSILGMLLVISGIILVILKKKRDTGNGEKGKVPVSGLKVKGYVFAFLAALGQAIGVVFSKKGLESGYNAVSATQIRLLAAILGVFLLGLVSGKLGELTLALKRKRPMVETLIGSVFGPALGVSLSLFAIQHTNAATASTLIALTPVLIIPPSIFIMKEKPGIAEIAGAVLAVSGTILFFVQ